MLQKPKMNISCFLTNKYEINGGRKPEKTNPIEAKTKLVLIVVEEFINKA